MIKAKVKSIVTHWWQSPIKSPRIKFVIKNSLPTPFYNVPSAFSLPYPSILSGRQCWLKLISSKLAVCAPIPIVNSMKNNIVALHVKCKRIKIIFFFFKKDELFLPIAQFTKAHLDCSLNGSYKNHINSFRN